MTRRPSNTQPMARFADTEPIPMRRGAVDGETTDPSDGPLFADTSPPSAELASEPAAPETTDPDGIDPLLAGFDKPPRPPAPKPVAKASTDGDDFAAHYAPPARIGNHVRPHATEPDGLVQVSTTEPPAIPKEGVPNDTTPDPPALVARRDVTTHVPRERSRKQAIRRAGIAIATVAILSVLVCVAYFSSERSKAALVVPTAVASSATNAAASVRPPSDQTSTVVPVSSVPSAGTTVPAPSQVYAPPATSRAVAAPVGSPVVGPSARSASPAAASAPRASSSDRPRTAPTRPAHETPDTDL